MIEQKKRPDLAPLIAEAIAEKLAVSDESSGAPDEGEEGEDAAEES